ncbi:MAG: phage virion morphogenesis protein [Burkholderiales bacterium]|nr:phage virion morphogenesis protein [Burkholderiales bacterium]
MPTVIAINNSTVNALLESLQQRTSDLSPVLMAIGEDIMERTKQRFSTATAPDGTPWATNSQTTLMRYLARRGGFSKKTGKISAKGQQLAIGKKPLMGESGDLARQFIVNANEQGVTVGSTMIYAAMQQFGGTKSQFPKLWGDIPARPFLPVMANGDLYPQEEAHIVVMLQDYLSV